MIPLNLTDEDFEYLLEKLGEVEDEGPPGYGWKSLKLIDFIRYLEEMKRENL